MKPISGFDTWLVRYRSPSPVRLRLFCFPYAGGGASVFRTWVTDLPQDIEVCLIQLPGRENRLVEPPLTQLTVLVQILVQVLRPHLNVPFAFFGHSMGALISFELTRQLHTQYSLSPALLFVSGFRAPHLPNRRPPIHQLPEPLFVEELRRLNGTSEAILQNAELIQLLLPTLRADFAICETYVYTSQEPLDCPIFAFGGLQDDEVSHEDVAAWRNHTCRVFRLRMLPGDHFFLHSAQDLLLRAISHDFLQLLEQFALSQSYESCTRSQRH